MPVVPPYFIELTTSFCNADKRFDSVGCKATSSSTPSLYQIHFCLASSDFIFMEGIFSGVFDSLIVILALLVKFFDHKN